MVSTEIALKSGFALILHALKSRFHCTIMRNCAYYAQYYSDANVVSLFCAEADFANKKV